MAKATEEEIYFRERAISCFMNHGPDGGDGSCYCCKDERVKAWMRKEASSYGPWLDNILRMYIHDGIVAGDAHVQRRVWHTIRPIVMELGEQAYDVASQYLYWGFGWGDSLALKHAQAHHTIQYKWRRDLLVRHGMAGFDAGRDNLGPWPPADHPAYSRLSPRPSMMDDEIASKRSATPSSSPETPDRAAGKAVLTDANGVVHDDVPGMGHRPRTHFGVEVRDTTIDGRPRQDPSPGAQPARTPAGTPIVGPNKQPLYKRPFG